MVLPGPWIVERSDRSAGLLRRLRGDDFLKARIAAERVPERQQF